MLIGSCMRANIEGKKTCLGIEEFYEYLIVEKGAVGQEPMLSSNCPQPAIWSPASLSPCI